MNRKREDLLRRYSEKRQRLAGDGDQELGIRIPKIRNVNKPPPNYDPVLAIPEKARHPPLAYRAKAKRFRTPSTIRKQAGTIVL